MINDLMTKKNNDEVIMNWERFSGAIDCGASGRVWNSDELIKLSKSVADSFMDKGLEKGDIVAVLLTNTVSFQLS